MKLASMADALGRLPKPRKGQHIELWLSPVDYQEMMHWTQGRKRFLGIPLQSDSAVTFAEARIVADSPRRGILVRLGLVAARP